MSVCVSAALVYPRQSVHLPIFVIYFDGELYCYPGMNTKQVIGEICSYQVVYTISGEMHIMEALTIFITAYVPQLAGLLD